MKTSEEFLKNFNEEENNIDKLYYDSYVKKAMIKFAKMHVQEALRLASVEAEVEHELSNPYDPNSEYQIVNKDSILNAYPLENIK